MSDNQKLASTCQQVLRQNSHDGRWTQPAQGLYPNQWLWDSAFIAIGYSTYDTDAAIKEIYSLLEGQWSNGMLPNMIFRSSGLGKIVAKMIWAPRSKDLMPEGISTSGITQPPVLATAALITHDRLAGDKKSDFAQRVLPVLERHHLWLYQERSPEGNGLITLTHPWETGLDNTPGWIDALGRMDQPFLLRLIQVARIDRLVDRLRPDTQGLDPDQRSDSIDGIFLVKIIRTLARHNYRLGDLPPSAAVPQVKSLSFNCILSAANHDLIRLAKTYNYSLSDELLSSAEKTDKSITKDLWTGEGFGHIDVRSDKLHKVEGVSQLLPLLCPALTNEQEDTIISGINDPDKFKANYPLPSVSMNSSDFNPRKYWQGPTWININWLVARALDKRGHHAMANELRKSSIDLVNKSGSFEYFSPLSGEPLGAPGFSWTAALILDMMENQ